MLFRVGRGLRALFIMLNEGEEHRTYRTDRTNGSDRVVRRESLVVELSDKQTNCSVS